ncbi:MAG: phospholipase D-like domain-containing protein, partial [Actinomycetota bacterium]
MAAVTPGTGRTMESERQLRRRLECLIGVHFTEGNAVTVLRNGDEIFPAMLEAIRGAQRSVNLMTYVYWKGAPAREFAAALSERARAGVRVRVLIDAIGGFLIEKGLIEAMEQAGVDVQWFRKPWLRSPFKQNHRCHRRVCIVDEHIGFTGGVGIAEEWCGDARDETEWRDTHIRVDGPAVDGLAAAFGENWAETGRALYDERDLFPEQPQPGRATIQVVRGSASIGWDDMQTVWYVLLRTAQTSIQLQTAYFSPDPTYLAAFCEAAERGVTVDVMVPGPH